MRALVSVKYSCCRFCRVKYGRASERTYGHGWQDGLELRRNQAGQGRWFTPGQREVV